MDNIHELDLAVTKRIRRLQTLTVSMETVTHPPVEQ